MAYDGIVISSVIDEIKTACLGGRVVKVQQPTPDTITLTVKGFKGQTKIYLSVNASLPIVYIAETLPQAPMQAPAFCMLLRKHISNGRLVAINQPGFDRIFDFVFEHMDEMGDISERHLIIEIMGRQSNIILTDEKLIILDCIRRVMPDLSDAISKDDDSNVRILYPGKEYETPDSQGKINVMDGFDRYAFEKHIVSKNMPIPKAIFTSLSGFSKSTSEQIVARAGVDGRKSFEDITVEEKDRLFDTLTAVVEDIKNGSFHPTLILDAEGIPKDYIVVGDSEGSMSKLLIDFYSNKEKRINIRSKSSDMRKHLQTVIARTAKKYDLQREQLKSTEDRDKFRVYGELINTYGYELGADDTVLKCTNYYDNTEVEIPIDSTLTPQENAQKYFAKYNKKKRTYEALTDFLKQTKEELDYLMSAKHSLDMAETDGDIVQIRKELEAAEVLKKKGREKGARKEAAGKPLHFLSSAGYDIFVGKNNIQNDELTFGLAVGKDIWFHAKQMPGSHVIVKLKTDDKGFDDVPDSVFEEAASLAAFYSSGNDAPKVEIDYTERKNLKKPPQAKPGYVIYHTNYSMMAEPKKTGVQQVDDQ